MIGSIIGTGINVVSNLIGGFIANKRKREAEEAYNDAIDAQIADLDREANTNYLDRADSRDALRKVTDANTETLRQLNTEAIRGGATDEAKVAMASKLNKTTADVVGNLAAMGEKHKDALNTRKRSLQLGAAQHKYTTGSDVSGMENVLQSIGTAAQNLGTAWVKDTPANGVVANNGVGTRTVSDMEPELIDKLKQVPFGQSK
jgi:hypothetical protein